MNPEYEEWVRVERTRLDLALDHPPLREWVALSALGKDGCLTQFIQLSKENKKRRGKRKW